MEYFYILELSVEAGRSKKDIMYVLATLEQVYNELQKDLVRDAGLAIWYGEEILLHRCQLNKTNNIAVIIETIDLHERITYYVGDFAPIKFDENNDVIGYHKSSLMAKSLNHLMIRLQLILHRKIYRKFIATYITMLMKFSVLLDLVEKMEAIWKDILLTSASNRFIKNPQNRKPIRYFQRKITLVTLDKGVTTEKELDFGPNDFGDNSIISIEVNFLTEKIIIIILLKL